MATLCPAGVTLRNQLNKKWPKRDKRSDGWIGDAAHSSRFSWHNPIKGADGVMRVWATDTDENFGLGKMRNGRQARIFANQLLEYIRSGLKGSDRVLHVVYEDQVASGTYRKWWWRFRGKGYDHMQHIHITFRDGAGADGGPFPLPCLAMDRGQARAWRRNLNLSKAHRR